MTSCLVTGGGGFVGSSLVRRLVADGHDVLVLDNFSTGDPDNLEGVRAEVRKGDLRDADAVRETVAGAEVIFHLAALPSVQRSIDDPLTTHAVNATGTLQLLDAAVAAGVRRLVYASSSSVYGDTPILPKEEGMSPVPRSPYASAKLAGEHYCRALAAIGKIETVCLRYFNVFGPRQSPAGSYAAVVPRFITALLDGRPPTIHGDGEQTRDFTYVDDVVEANVLAARAGPAASGEWVNVAHGARTSLNGLLDVLYDITGARRVEPLRAPPRPGEVRDSYADVSKAQRLIGYEPAVDLRAGLTATVEWYRERVAG